MITIGTDPELFVANGKGEAMPVCGKLGGSKGNAIDIGNGIGLQEDNVMAEFNIEPQTDCYQFGNVVADGVETVMDFVRTKMGADTKAIHQSAVHFPGAMLQSRKAQEFGCSADFDAYTRGSARERIDPAVLEDAEGAWRFAGGHVHLGWDNTVNEIPDFVAASFADLFLGLAAVNGDKQGKRREFYGRPGLYRPTPYGIEYRVLSNFWIFDRYTATNVGSLALGLGNLLEGDPDRVRHLFKEVPWADVRRAIADENTGLAQSLLNHFARHEGLALGEIA